MRVTKKKNHKQTDKKTGSPCGSGGPVSKEKKGKTYSLSCLRKYSRSKTRP